MKENVTKGFLKSFKNLNFKEKEVEKMKKVITILAAVVALTLLVCGSALAVPITPFQLNTPYGNPISADPANPLIAELDWLPGSGLAVNANAMNPPVNAPFEFLYQLKLGSIIDVNNNAVSDPTLNGFSGPGGSPTPYEFTTVSRLWENAVGLGGWVSTFTLAGDPTGVKPNMIEIYADKYDGTPGQGVQANVATGVGFNDGQLALQGIPVGITSIFNVTDNPGDPVGVGVPDNQDTGTGSAQVIYQVTWFNPAYFTFPWDPTNDPVYVMMQYDGTLTLPPAGVHTPTMWDGTATNYYTPVVGGTSPFNTNDLMFKVDGNSHFAPIPEPATMFLFGSGLVSLAGFARKKLKKGS